MRYLIALYILAILLAAHEAEAKSSMLQAYLEKHASVTAVDSYALSTAIQKTAKKYALDPFEIARVVLQESRGVELAYNPASQDHGLMQINIFTALERGISLECLYNWKCNLDAGAQILAALHRRTDYRVCLYNVGPRGAKKKLKKCLAYEAKLEALN
jgi:soluble lytic murein transglycosylase-like protein